MASQIVVLALIFFAVVVGMASATANAPNPSSSAAPQQPIDFGPTPDNDVIGTISGSGSDYGAAPVGGPVSAGTFSSVSPAESPNSSSTILESSTVAGVVVSAFVGSLFF